MSIDANCTVLSTLLASIWIDRPRVWPKLTFRVKPRFITDVPGPMIMLRPALPNVPAAGIENAAVLKNSSDRRIAERDRLRRCSWRAACR